MNEAFTEYGRLVDSGPYTGLPTEQAHEKMIGGREGEGLRRGRNDLPAEGLGHFAAALLGHADSRSFTARKMASLPVPDDQLPVRLPENVTLTGAGAIAAGERAGIREHDVSEMRRPGAARNGHDGYVRRFVLVFLPLHRSAQRARAVR